jgi:hypothetical protein
MSNTAHHPGSHLSKTIRVWAMDTIYIQMRLSLNIRAAKYQLGVCTMAVGADFYKKAVAKIIRR